MLTIKTNKISVIQKEFNELFPFLKLEFFRNPFDRNDKTARPEVMRNEVTLKPSDQANGEICVTDEMPVSTLEQLFLDVFGIRAQVFRKSGASWLETRVTNDWTLKRQNDEGRELSSLKKS